MLLIFPVEAMKQLSGTEPPVNTVCQLALVDCSPDITVIVDPEVEVPNDDDDVDRETETEDTRNDNNVITERKTKLGTGSTGGIISGVVVTLFLVILTVAVGIVVGLKCQRRGQVKITTAHNPAYEFVQRSDVPDTASVFYINLQQGTSIRNIR